MCPLDEHDVDVSLALRLTERQLRGIAPELQGLLDGRSEIKLPELSIMISLFCLIFKAGVALNAEIKCVQTSVIAK